MTALWHAFVRASLIGRMLACTSIKLFGDVLRVPVIARAAVHWIFCKLCRNVTKPEFLIQSSFLLGG